VGGLTAEVCVKQFAEGLFAGDDLIDQFGCTIVGTVTKYSRRLTRLNYETKGANEPN